MSAALRWTSPNAADKELLLVRAPAGAGNFLIARQSSAIRVMRAVAPRVWKTPMVTLDLRADCARCAALCCVALFFDRDASFAIDKPAGVPCPNLDGNGACAIHAQRVERGFSGCVHYDCHGAGQRVTQSLFGGRDWRIEPDLIGPMTEGFYSVARIHRILVVLVEAARLPLPDTDGAELETLTKELSGCDPLRPEAARLEAKAAAFLVGLRRYAPG